MAASVTDSLGKIKLSIQNYPENKHKTKVALVLQSWANSLADRAVTKNTSQSFHAEERMVANENLHLHREWSAPEITETERNC